MEQDQINKIFLEAQLFNFMSLRSILKNNPLTAEQKDACNNAIIITAASIDQLLAHNPELNNEVDKIGANLFYKETKNV